MDNRGTTNAKGVFFSLESESGNKFYKRVFVSEKSKITERGITWLGAVQTHRNMYGSLRKISLSVNFGFTWIIALFGILGLILWAVAKAICFAFCWLIRKIGDFFNLLWKAILAIIAWFFRPKLKTPKEKKPQKPMNLRWLGWLLLALALLALLLFLLKDCGGKKETVIEPEYYTQSDADYNSQLYDECIYDACKIKGYLDGFQTKAKPLGNGRYVLLLGISEQNGQWITKDAAVSKSNIYQKTKEYFLSKKNIFLSSVHKRLEPQQMKALMLVHLRMGSTGFAGKLIDGTPSQIRSESDLVKAINNQEIITRLFRLPGTEAKTEANKESLQYFWVLYQIYCGNLSVDEVYSFPMQSYLSIPLNDMYEEDYPVWKGNFKQRLNNGLEKSFKASGVMPE